MSTYLQSCFTEMFSFQNPSIVVLQNELEAQETVIIGYQQENEKMCTELKDIKVSIFEAKQGTICQSCL